MRLRAQVIGLLTASCLLLAGCTSVAGSAPGRTLVTSGVEAPALAPPDIVPSEAVNCRPFGWRATTPEVRAQLHTLNGCTDNLRLTRVTNVSTDLVWIIDGFQWDEASADPKIWLYRDYVSRVNGRPLMTLEPGTTADLRALPSQVHLRLDSFVQSSWDGYELLIDTAKEKSVDLVDDTIKERKTTGALLYTCFRTGWEVGDTINKATEAPDQALRDALLLSDEIGGCTDKVAELEAEFQNQSQTPPLQLEDLRIKTQPRSTWAAETSPLLKAAIRRLATRGKSG
jgi:hypothetical protein